MASSKCLIVLAALAVTIFQQVLAEREDVAYMCYTMSKEMQNDKDSITDSRAAYHFARKFIADYTKKSESDKQTLLEALDAVSSDADCSASSYQHILYASECVGQLSHKALQQATEKYVNKCLTAEGLSAAIRTAVSRPDAKRVDFVDARFVKKYYLDNPNDVPLHVGWFRHNKRPAREQPQSCCKYNGSYGAVNDAIERDFSSQGKDAKEVFRETIGDVYNYLTSKLFNPCLEYARYYKGLANDIGAATYYYDGEEEGLIAKLQQEDKDILFRYKYCQMLKGFEYKVQKEVETNFGSY